MYVCYKKNIEILIFYLQNAINTFYNLYYEIVTKEILR